MQPHRWARAQRSLDYPCPVCQNGALRPIKDTFKQVENENSQSHDGEGNPTPEDMEWRFSALLKCTNTACAGVASITGRKFIEPPQYGEDHETVFYRPNSITPGPLPIPLHTAYPNAVSDQVRKAATLFWADPGAAANRIRQAVDEMLTEQGVARYAKPDSSSPIPLQQRINAFKELQDGKFAEIAAFLEAIKWLGNAGSHDGDLKAAEVLDAFDILGHVLEEIYIQPKAKLLAKVAKLNAAYAPPKKA